MQTDKTERKEMALNGEQSHSDDSQVTPDSAHGHSTTTGDSIRDASFRNVNKQPDALAERIATKGFFSTSCLRVMVVCLFIFMGIYIPIILHQTATENERDSFETEFQALAAKVVGSFEFNIARKFGAMDAMDIALTSYAVGSNETFPFVTMPDFDLNAANTLALADTYSIFLTPMVPRNQQQEWQAYASDNLEWIEVAWNREPLHQEARRLEEPASIYPTIYYFGENGEVLSVTNTTNDDPYYFPIWQNGPTGAQTCNFNIMSVETFKRALDAMVEAEVAILGLVAEFSENEAAIQIYFDSLLDSGEQHLSSEPMSHMFYPAFSSFDRHTKEFGSSLVMTVYWRTFFERMLPSNTKPVICVVENACGQSFTYRIKGQEAEFVGMGDKHNRKYDSDAVVLEVNKIEHSATMPLSQDFCPHNMTVYPSQALEDEFVTIKPVLFTFLVALAFVLIFAVAITYDCVVQRRLKNVLDSALESRAIISSLFPEKFRDRLFEHEDGPTEDKTFGESTELGNLQPAKVRLKSFIDENPHGNNSVTDANILQTKPIADLFPHCTVLFADIAGFTAWSSEREPAQVFTLLQTIFHYFDDIARKWGVFKIETIGDCYVAVTGLPDPQADHAVRMTKFARESLRTVSELTHQLETSLGPDTGELSMRFGLHSGPVTAGVLRGEKSRFQLFGDTVNTASRMENTGKRDNIQISQATADLLTEAGKGHWLTAREDLVSAKGKGQIQTYWVKVQKSDTASSRMFDSAHLSPNGKAPGASGAAAATPSNAIQSIPAAVVDSSQNRKLRRLVDWQTDILARLLQQIIAQRDRRTAAKFVSDPVNAIEKGDCVLDEVADILVLPTFEEKAKNVVDPKSIELSPAVTSQLRDYVGTIAVKYHDNPFHNFEHASHVTMSASKLLSRIVVPETVNYQRENKKDIASDLHDFTYGITSDPLTQFAVIFCSLIHDVDHRGVTNFQLGVEKPDMAKHYKNRSLAEQKSVDIAWDLLMQPEFRNLQQSIFSTDAELKRFRQLLVNLLLATDIFDKEFKTLRNSRWDRAFHQANTNKEEQFNLKSTIVIEHIIQAADVAHTMQHWHVYTKWNERLFQEMYVAYDSGRNAKDPSEGWYKGELWFFDNYVIPLGKKLDECHVFGVASDEGLNYALANRAEWALKGENLVQEMVQRYLSGKKKLVNAPELRPKATARRFSLGSASDGGSSSMG